jgi:enoyl-CoA hydratase
MAYETLICEIKEGIAYITINRPKVLNALSDSVIDELEQVFIAVKEEDDVKAVILTGAGEKAFVAGADISQLVNLNPLEGKLFAEKGQKVLSLIEGLGKPVIAAVNGFALGGGCELAMACTLRLASSNAKLGQPEVNLGIIPGYGGTQRLSRLVGKGRALELVLTGRMVDAQEAREMGLVNKVVEPDRLMEEAENLARTIMSKGPVAVKLGMEAVNRGMEVSLDEGLRIEADLFGVCCATEDKMEGTKAFLEKRKPRFQGR